MPQGRGPGAEQGSLLCMAFAAACACAAASACAVLGSTAVAWAAVGRRVAVAGATVQRTAAVVVVVVVPAVVALVTELAASAAAPAAQLQLVQPFAAAHLPPSRNHHQGAVEVLHLTQVA